jgi:hypothetical protein
MSTRIKADALAKAALQATARALHTATLARDAYVRCGANEGNERLMANLRDGLLDCYGGIQDADRQRILATPATITSDELIDLLAMCVKG